MDKIISELIIKYHIRKINDKEISIIVSYKEDLEAIASKYNMKLEESANNAGGLTVWGKLSI